MQIEALKIFCDVVRWTSFSRAAAENGVSQSSASHVVLELEKRLGVKLIDRSKRPLVPTVPGQVYYNECKELISRYFELENRVQALGDGHQIVGTARVASIYSVGLHTMRQFVDRFAALYPQAEVRLEYLHPTRVVEEVQQGNADLGILSFPRRWPDLVVIPWREEPMVLAVHPAHALAKADSITAAELDGSRLVGFDNALAIRRAIDRFLRRNGIQVEVVLEFDNIENIKRAVEVPGGAAILPAPCLAREVAAGTIVAVPFRGIEFSRPITIIHRRGGDLGPTTSHFLHLLIGDAPPTTPTNSKRQIAEQPA